MKNYIQENDALVLKAPAGGVISGELLNVGHIIGVAVQTAAAGEDYTLMIQGAFDSLPKKHGESWSIGDMLYFNPDTKLLQKTLYSGDTRIFCIWAGFAFYPAAENDTTGALLLKH